MKQKIWKQAKQFIDKLGVDEVIDFDISTRDYGDELNITIDVTIRKDEIEEIEENEEKTVTIEFDEEAYAKDIDKLLGENIKKYTRVITD